MPDVRRQIILDYAKWTALSALRAGAPIKSRRDVYPLLDAVPFEDVLGRSRTMSTSAFDAWHETATAALCARDARLSTGWSTKLINVYLKTAAYVGGLGPKGLSEALHPPIDSGLWSGLAQRFKGRAEILDDVCCVRRIKDITDYLTYRRIIDGCRRAAQALDCSLIEVEQLWQGPATPVQAKRRRTRTR